MTHRTMQLLRKFSYIFLQGAMFCVFFATIVEFYESRATFYGSLGYMRQRIG